MFLCAATSESNRVTADRISFFCLIKIVCFEIWGKVTVLLNKKLNKGSITAFFFFFILEPVKDPNCYSSQRQKTVVKTLLHKNPIDKLKFPIKRLVRFTEFRAVKSLIRLRRL